MKYLIQRSRVLGSQVTKKQATVEFIPDSMELEDVMQVLEYVKPMQMQQAYFGDTGMSEGIHVFNILAINDIDVEEIYKRSNIGESLREILL